MKKTIPFTVLAELQSIADKNTDVVKPIISNDSFFHLVDCDSSSDLFFKVTRQQEFRNNEWRWIFERKPKSHNEVSSGSEWGTIKYIVQELSNWIRLISDYNNLNTIYDDPILKSYEKQFLKDFEIIDEDAFYAPFNLNQQMFLDEYLSKALTKIESLKESQSEEKVTSLTNLQKEAEIIKDVITKESKRQVLNRLVKLWSKAQKIGLDVIKEIFVSVTSEIAKKLITGG